MNKLTRVLGMAVPESDQHSAIESGEGTEQDAPIGEVDEEEPELAWLVVAQGGDDDCQEVQAQEPSIDQVPFAMRPALPLQWRGWG